MTTPYQILAADKIADEGLAYIKAQPDAKLTYKPGISEDELAGMIGDYDGLIVRSGVQVSSKVLAKPGRLKGIARAGVGVDNIDLDAATAAGILVMNSAQASTITTAEHAFALMMALARNIGQAHHAMQLGRWDRSKFQGTQLAGKTLAVVGFGRIGQTVAKRALAFDMNVIAYDPFVNSDTALDGKVKMYADFDGLLPHADIFTFHVPLNDQTRGLLNDDTFAKCKKGILVVNASRGGVVDEQALMRALENDQCAGAAMDVYVDEPPAGDHPFRKHPHILMTPHLGASTKEAQEAVSVDAAVALLEYLRGDGIHGAVNVAGLRLDLDPIQCQYVDLASRMAKLISPMICQGIKQITLEIAGEQLAAASTTLERMALISVLQPHLDTTLNLVNVKHIAQSRGINLRSIKVDNETANPGQLILEVQCANDDTHRIIGSVYSDHKPRILEINGYRMDMVPTGHMMLLRNEDRPGMIGIVGTAFGDCKINIADMCISRREDSALMLLNLDAQPDQAIIDRLLHCPGILKVATVKLPEEKRPKCD